MKLYYIGFPTQNRKVLSFVKLFLEIFTQTDVKIKRTSDFVIGLLVALGISNV